MSIVSNAFYRAISKSYLFLEKHFHLHITQPHFYSPLPNVASLTDAHFDKLFSCNGVQFKYEQQVQLAEEFARYQDEYMPLANTGLSLVDSFMLYAMIRGNKPARMIEVGSGYSTKIALEALRKNRSEGFDFHFTAIEPFPGQHLKDISEPGFELLIEKVENVNLEFFTDIDLLFIDSSHVSKIGSDVNFQVLEIVPHLKTGALIHWHDIMFPREYPKRWIQTGTQFWNESYLIQAFLAFNNEFEIKWASKYMQTYASDELKRLFPYFETSHNISSLWVRRK